MAMVAPALLTILNIGCFIPTFAKHSGRGYEENEGGERKGI